MKKTKARPLPGDYGRRYYLGVIAGAAALSVAGNVLAHAVDELDPAVVLFIHAIPPLIAVQMIHMVATIRTSFMGSIRRDPLTRPTARAWPPLPGVFQRVKRWFRSWSYGDLILATVLVTLTSVTLVVTLGVSAVSLATVGEMAGWEGRVSWALPLMLDLPALIATLGFIKARHRMGEDARAAAAEDQAHSGADDAATELSATGVEDARAERAQAAPSTPEPSARAVRAEAVRTPEPEARDFAEEFEQWVREEQAQSAPAVSEVAPERAHTGGAHRAQEPDQGFPFGARERSAHAVEALSLERTLDFDPVRAPEARTVEEESAPSAARAAAAESARVDDAQGARAAVVEPASEPEAGVAQPGARTESAPSVQGLAARVRAQLATSKPVELIADVLERKADGASYRAIDEETEVSATTARKWVGVAVDLDPGYAELVAAKS